MKRKIRLAVIGCGRQADLAFLPWIKEHRGAELAAVADMNEDMARRAAERYGALSHFTDWRAMLDSTDLDGVIVCTPPWAHAEPVVEAAKRGINVLCEKPMAVTVADCKKMCDAAEKYGIFFQIGFSLRFDPGYEALKSLIKKGEIGKVFQLRSTYDSWVPDLSHPFVQQAMGVIEKAKIFPPGMGAWRMNDTRTGGGVYSDHAIHYIDMFHWFMEEDVTHVSGRAQHVVEGRTNEDHASSMLRFESGAAAYVQSSLCRFSARGSRDEGLIHGSEGCAKYAMDQTWYLLGFPHLYNTHARVWKFGVPSFIVNRFLPVPVKFGKSHCMFKRQLDHFVSKINGEFEPHPVIGDNWGASGRDGLNSIRVVRAFYDSDKKGRTVCLAAPGSQS